MFELKTFNYAEMFCYLCCRVTCARVVEVSFRLLSRSQQTPGPLYPRVSPDAGAVELVPTLSL